jgi:hypothetical protein
MQIALLLGPTLGGGGHIERLLIVEAILALAAAAILIWELRAPAPNEGPGEERAAVDGRAVRALWAKPQMRNMAELIFVGFGTCEPRPSPPSLARPSSASPPRPPPAPSSSPRWASSSCPPFR